MPRRKAKESHIRNLTKLGGESLGLTIPIRFVRRLRWRERQKVVVKLRGKGLIVKDWQPKKGKRKRRSNCP